MNKERKYKRIGWLTSILVQFGMLLLFYFLIAWREPFPPIPTYGIELDFGFQETGSGINPLESSEDTPQEVENKAETAVEEETEENLNEPIEESVVDSEDADDPIVEETDFDDLESPDIVEEVEAVESAVEPPIRAESIDESNPVQEVVETQEEKDEELVEAAPEPALESAIDENALMPSNNTTKNNNQSQGDGDLTGDQGNEEGEIDGRAVYGSQGNSDGASLQMAGWTWDFKPEPNDKSFEAGKIVYKIIIDEDGYLSRIDLVSSTVSPEIERFYKQSIERLSFSKTNDYKSAPTSTGYVTFIIKTK